MPCGFPPKAHQASAGSHSCKTARKFSTTCRVEPITQPSGVPTAMQSKVGGAEFQGVKGVGGGFFIVNAVLVFA